MAAECVGRLATGLHDIPQTPLSRRAPGPVLKSIRRSCHGGCGVLLLVRDACAEGRRRPRFALNHGWLCRFGTVTTDSVCHPDRLKYPLRRKGNNRSTAWHRVTWIRRLMSCRASARIGERHGPEAISLGTRTGRHHIRISVGSRVSAMRRARPTGGN